MLTVAQTTKNISNFMVRKSSLQEITPLVIIWRPVGMVQNLSLPDYSGELNALCSVLQ